MTLNIQLHFLKFGFFLLFFSGKSICSEPPFFKNLTTPMVNQAYSLACKNYKKIPSAKQEWTPLYPVPKEYQNVDLTKESHLLYMLKWTKETARYAYRCPNGELLGYVVRLEDKTGKKILPMLTYCQNINGNKQWHFKSFGDDRPLYGLDILKKKPRAPVLIVEGEKTCDAARKIFETHAAITWSGGYNSVHKSNWSALNKRDVTIWPDNDEVGRNAAFNIADILYKNKAKSISIVNYSQLLPPKWDLADPLPEGLTYDGLIKNKIFLMQPSNSLKNKKYS